MTDLESRCRKLNAVHENGYKTALTLVANSKKNSVEERDSFNEFSPSSVIRHAM